jgi:hypothetical protein
MIAASMALLFDKHEHANEVARGLGLGGLGTYVLSLPLAIGVIRRYRGAQVLFPLPATPFAQ